MPKTYSAILHAGVQVSVVPPNGIGVGRSRSRPREDDRERGHGPAIRRSDQRVRAKRRGAQGQRPTRPAPFRANAGTRSSGGNTWTEPFHDRFNPSSLAPNQAVACTSTSAPSPTSGDPERWCRGRGVRPSAPRGERESPRISSVRASACGARTARLAVRLLPLLTASTASLSLLLRELVNRVSVAQLERPVEDRLRQVGCVLDDAHRPSHRSTTNTQSGGRLRLSQDVRVRRRTMTLGLLRGNRRKQRELLRR